MMATLIAPLAFALLAANGSVGASILRPQIPQQIFCERAETASAYSQIGFRFLRPGQQGWIFRDRTDFAPLRTFDTAQIAALTRFTRALNQRGTRLIVVVPPPRGLTAAPHILPNARGADRFNAAAIAHFQAELLKQIRTAGAIAPDLISAGQRDLTGQPGGFANYYYRVDSHWSPLGAASAGRETGLSIQRAGLAPPPKANPYETLILPPETGPALYRRELGSLCGPQPVAPAITHYRTETTSADGLLGDAKNPEFTLIGTSFSNMGGRDKADFAGTLRKTLGADVSNRAMPGGGADMAMNDFLLHARWPVWPKALIWEFPPHLLPTEDAFAQFEGAVAGDCPKTAILKGQAKTISVLGTPLLSPKKGTFKPNATLPPVLVLQTDARNLRKFDILLGYDDGTVKRINFELSPAAAAPNKYYLALPWRPEALRDISFLHQQPVSGKIQARLCAR
jgi:alginate O-acetyltransferase complex protein AlgJ